MTMVFLVEIWSIFKMLKKKNTENVWKILKVREPHREKTLEEKVELTRNLSSFNDNEAG